MPLYDYQCGSKACGKRTEHYAHYNDKSTRPCECGGAAHRLPAFLSDPGRAPRPERMWSEKEGRSFGLTFDPSGIRELKQEVPSIELDADGNAVFRSERHQRQVYREIQRTKDRYAEEARQEAEQAQEQGRLEDAAAARDIAEKFGVPQEVPGCPASALPIDPRPPNPPTAAPSSSPGRAQRPTRSPSRRSKPSLSQQLGLEPKDAAA